MASFLITGATGGIGGAIAEALHARGDDLLLAGRDQHRLAALAERLPGSRTVRLDLARPETLAGAVDGLDRLDGLIHSAGVVELGTVAETPVRVWLDTLTVNLAAPAELTRALLPALRAARGHVVFVNSGSGQQAKARWSSYAASKFGLRALADALRQEEATNGVRVTTVYPGRTATGMQRHVREQEGGRYDPEEYVRPESVAALVLAALDMPPGTEVTEVCIRPAR